jgi:hypothetical protein
MLPRGAAREEYTRLIFGAFFVPACLLLIQIKTFVSEGSKKILESGLKDGSTLAERTEKMLERKRKASKADRAGRV